MITAKLNIAAVAALKPSKRLYYTSTILRSWGVRFNQGLAFWECNAGTLDLILFDARKAWKRLRKDFIFDHSKSVEVNRQWEFIKSRFRDRNIV